MTVKSSSVGYVVLPPGHGKSYRHDEGKGLLEADTVVPCKSTDELKHLRSVAKVTNDWAAYDRAWARDLNGKLSATTCRLIVMVPHESVGEAAGWIPCGGILLEEKTWSLNFSQRQDSAAKYKELWNHLAQAGSTIVATNDELTLRLNIILHNWVAGGQD